MSTRPIAEWAFAISGNISSIAEQRYPQDYRTWPLISSFDFEAIEFQMPYIIVTLRDRLSGIPSGPGSESRHLYLENCPASPTPQNVAEWQTYLISQLGLRPQDAVFLIPLQNLTGSVEASWELWSGEERGLWQRQLECTLSRQYFHRRGLNNMGDFMLPPGYQFLQEECARFFQVNTDYNRNVFIMTRFSPGNRLLETIDTTIRATLIQHGFNPVRADDRMFMTDRNLWNNVCVYMHCSKYGIAILEDRIANEFNPNVALEYGFMRALNKPVLLLADEGFRNLRADVIGTLRETFDITNIEETIGAPISRWLREVGAI
jgi:hypothetical protein